MKNIENKLENLKITSNTSKTTIVKSSLLKIESLKTKIP